MVQPPPVLWDRCGVDPGPISEPWLGPPLIERRLKMLGFLMLKLLCCSYTVTGDTWKPLVTPCLFLSEQAVVGRWVQRTGQHGGAQPCPAVCAPSQRPLRGAGGGTKIRRREEGRQELPVPSPPPPTVAPRTPTPGTASHPGGA